MVAAVSQPASLPQSRMVQGYLKFDDLDPEQFDLEQMSRQQARECLEALEGSVDETSGLFLELYEGQGHRHLGYSSIAELSHVHFSFPKAVTNQLVIHGKIRQAQQVCGRVGHPNGDQIVIPASHARELVGLTEEEQQEIYQEAILRFPNGDLTAAKVAEVREELHAPPEAEEPELLEPKTILPRRRNGVADGTNRTKHRLRQIRMLAKRMRDLHAGLVDVADDADEALDRYLDVVEGTGESV